MRIENDYILIAFHNRSSLIGIIAPCHHLDLQPRRSQLRFDLLHAGTLDLLLHLRLHRAAREPLCGEPPRVVLVSREGPPLDQIVLSRLERMEARGADVARVTLIVLNCTSESSRVYLACELITYDPDALTSW